MEGLRCKVEGVIASLEEGLEELGKGFRLRR
jgi:hypothetical protein